MMGEAAGGKAPATGGPALPEPSLAGRQVHFFEPGAAFPSFSVTGRRCLLDCAHCGGRYLEHMIDVSDPEELVFAALELNSRGGLGFLLSGGCGPGGEVDLSGHLEAIERVRRETGLIINAHTGLIGREAARDLHAAGVQVVSADVVGDVETIRGVYGSGAGPDDYLAALDALAGAGDWHIVPHVCLGLGGAEETGPAAALDMLAGWGRLDALVVISLIPTRGTGMEDASPVPPGVVAGFISRAVAAVDAPVMLGCMRPKRGDRPEEKMALDAGAAGVVLPHRSTVEHVRARGARPVFHDGCCALLPGLLEDGARRDGRR